MEHQEATDPVWIAADMQARVLRVWHMSGSREHAEASAILPSFPTDAAQLTDALRPLIQPWRGTEPVQVVISGFEAAQPASSWPAVPCTPLPVDLSRVAGPDPGLLLYAVPGLRQTTPPDLMCGDETRLAGFLSLNPTFDGVACLPGPVTRWIRISAGEIVSFRSVLTGALTDSLSSHSVLRHSLGDPGWDEAAFLTALDEVQTRPARLTAALFGIRAEGLLSGLSSATARARLTGWLIGAEMIDTRPYWRDQPIALIAETATAGPYLTALTHLASRPTHADAAAMTRKGLIAARFGESPHATSPDRPSKLAPNRQN